MTAKGDIPEAWRMVPLGDLGIWGSGGTPSRSNAKYHGGDIPWLKIGDLTDGPIWAAEESITNEGLENSSAKLLPPDTILLAMYGSIGKIGVTKISCATNQAIAFCVCDEESIDHRYLFWGLRYLRPTFVSLGQGGTQQNISQTLLKQVPLPVAPRREQGRIVEKIETLFAELDKGEESLRQGQTLLARYRRSVLKAAVTGELTADWRAERADKLEHGRDLLERILQTRRETWEGRGTYKAPSEPDADALPGIPDSWIWASIDQVVGVFRNGLSKKPTSEPNEFPILRISATRALNVAIDDVRYYPAADHTEVEASWVEKGDLLFTRYSGSAHFVGVCGQMREDDPVLHPDKLIKARAVEANGLDVDFLEIAWNAGETRRHIASKIKTTSGQQGIAGADIKAAPFPLPPPEEQARIVAIVWDALDRVSDMQAHCESELARSAALRQSILKDAFSGRLVPQDPNDEPASELLARIRQSRNPDQGKSGRKKRAAGA